MIKRKYNIKKPNILDRMIRYLMPRYAAKRIQSRRDIYQQRQVLNIPKGRRVISEGIKLSDIKRDDYITVKFNDVIDSAERAHSSITTISIDPDQFPT